MKLSEALSLLEATRFKAPDVLDSIAANARGAIKSLHSADAFISNNRQFANLMNQKQVSKMLIKSWDDTASAIDEALEAMEELEMDLKDEAKAGRSSTGPRR